jgi:hypothetical protein
VNPDVVVLAGIGTNPSGQSVSAQIILNAVQSVRSVVDGWWLNDPQMGLRALSATVRTLKWS